MDRRHGWTFILTAVGAIAVLSIARADDEQVKPSVLRYAPSTPLPTSEALALAMAFDELNEARGTAVIALHHRRDALRSDLDVVPETANAHRKIAAELRAVEELIRQVSTGYVLDLSDEACVGAFREVMRTGQPYPFAIAPPPLKPENFELLDSIAAKSMTGGWGDGVGMVTIENGADRTIRTLAMFPIRHVFGQSIDLKQLRSIDVPVKFRSLRLVLGDTLGLVEREAQ